MENIVKNSEFMRKLGPRYFTLFKIFRKTGKSSLFSEIFQIS